MLHPNNKQRTKLFQCFGVSRFAYNWALGRQQENHKNGGKFISAFDLHKEFGQLKKSPEYGWLNNYSNVIPLMAIIDATEEDVRGNDVYGVLPLRLASFTNTVTSIDMNIPAEMRGKELSLEDIKKYLVDISTYKVEKI